MAEEKDLQAALSALDTILGSTKLDDVTSESGAGFENLPDGYYLAEVEKAELTQSKSSGNLQVKFTFKVVNNGYEGIIDEATGNFILNELSGTKGRKIFKYYPLKDSRSVTSFVSDMLKFEGEEPGVPVLDKEYFTNHEVLADALDILTGMYIYTMLSTTERNGEKNQWTNLISWDRAAKLELPME